MSTWFSLNTQTPLTKVNRVTMDDIKKRLDSGNFDFNEIMNSGLELTEITNSHRKNLLHFAAEQGNLEVVEKLLKLNFNVDAFDESQLFGKTNHFTALHYACQKGNLKVVELLLEEGHADLHIQSDHGIPVIFAAIESGSMDLLDYLLAKGADIKACDYRHRTCLHQAVVFEQFEMIDKFIALGLDVRAIDRNKRTLLHEACEFPNTILIQKLLNMNIFDPNVVDDEDQSAFDMICTYADSEAVELALKHGAKVDTCDYNGYTPLHNAISGRKTENVKILLEHGADPNLKTTSTQTIPLSMAIQANDAEMVNALLKYGADSDVVDKKGVHILVEACLVGNRDIIAGLYYASNEFKNTPHRRTIFHIACEVCDKSIVEYLLSLGAAVDSKDADGNTPLHLAAKRNDPQIIELLLSHKADANIKNNAGKRAFENEKKSSFFDCFKF